MIVNDSLVMNAINEAKKRNMSASEAGRIIRGNQIQGESANLSDYVCWSHSHIDGNIIAGAVCYPPLLSHLGSLYRLLLLSRWFYSLAYTWRMMT